MKKVAIFVVVAAAFALILSSLSSNPSVATGNANKSADGGCEGPSPECYPKLDMVDINGEVFTPESLEGKVVLINFWATWCKPCKKEIPDFARALDRYRDRGLVILGILNEDVAQETMEKFVADTGMNYPVVRWDDDVLTAFHYPKALPTTFIYDTQGKLHKMRKGAMSEAELVEVLDGLLDAAAQP